MKTKSSKRLAKREKLRNRKSQLLTDLEKRFVDHSFRDTRMDRLWCKHLTSIIAQCRSQLTPQEKEELDAILTKLDWRGQSNLRMDVENIILNSFHKYQSNSVFSRLWRD